MMVMTTMVMTNPTLLRSILTRSTLSHRHHLKIREADHGKTNEHARINSWLQECTRSGTDLPGFTKGLFQCPQSWPIGSRGTQAVEGCREDSGQPGEVL